MTVNPLDSVSKSPDYIAQKTNVTKNIPTNLEPIGPNSSTQDSQQIQKNQSAFSALKLVALGIRLGVGALGVGLIAINLFNPATLVGVALTVTGVLGAASVNVVNSLVTTGKFSLLAKPTVISAVIQIPSALTGLTGLVFLLPIIIGGNAIRAACS